MVLKSMVVMGGTFSPPHRGHISVATAALECVERGGHEKVMRFLLSPAHQGYDKRGKLPVQDRLCYMGGFTMSNGYERVYDNR